MIQNYRDQLIQTDHLQKSHATLEAKVAELQFHLETARDDNEELVQEVDE